MAPLRADVPAGQWRQRGTLAAAGMLRTSPTPQAKPRLKEELTAFMDGHSAFEVAAKSRSGAKTALVEGTERSKTRPKVDPHRS